MNFASDNVYGVDPRIMQAMVDANQRLTDVSYSHDDGAVQCERELSSVFEKEVKVFLTLNGTGANSLALSTITQPYGGVFCHEASHINTDECNAPELFTGGAKFITLTGEGGKITAAAISEKLKNFVHGEHGAHPSAISISNATELGTIYVPQEVAAIAKIAKAHDMKLHMDGARFANALVSVGCTPAELTWKSGVDVLSFGGTKNGGMIIEAVVFFDTTLADFFLYRRKRAAQHLSKGRYLSAQLLAYLKDDLWLSNAKRANALAQTLANGLEQSNRIKLSNPVQANEVFAYMPRSIYDAVQAKGAHFYEWPLAGTADDEVHCRFVLSFATPEKDVDHFVNLIKTI